MHGSAILFLTSKVVYDVVGRHCNACAFGLNIVQHAASFLVKIAHANKLCARKHGCVMEGTHSDLTAGITLCAGPHGDICECQPGEPGHAAQRRQQPGHQAAAVVAAAGPNTKEDL